MPNLSVNVPPGLLKDLKRLAAKRLTTVSTIVRQELQKAVDQDQPAPRKNPHTSTSPR